MTRFIRLIAVLIGLAVLSAQDPVNAAGNGSSVRPTIAREHVVVASANVRLGDVFSNVGPMSDTVIAEAPPVGAPFVFDVYTLARIARSFGLEWRPTSVRDRVVIERDSVVVDDERIVSLLRESLAEQGMIAGHDIAIDLGVRNRNFKIPTGADLSVENLSYRPGGRRFSAMLVAMTNDDRVVQRVSAGGSVYRMIDVPVVVRRIRRGEVIGKADLEWIQVRDRRVPARAVLDDRELIGLTPRRFLRPGVPVLTSELRRPILVEKNALITMIVAGPTMQLTARGRALEGGSKGDVIRVANLQSQTIVTGWITADGTVVVGRRMVDGDRQG